MIIANKSITLIKMRVGHLNRVATFMGALFLLVYLLREFLLKKFRTYNSITYFPFFIYHFDIIILYFIAINCIN